MKMRTPDEELANSIMEKSFTRVDGHMQLAIPWRSGRPRMPDNRRMALSRLQHTEKKLAREPKLAEEYKAVFHKYLSRGYIKKIPPSIATPPCQWLLPHFPVVRSDKPTSKVRPVFDGGARCEGVSINDVQCQGENLQALDSRLTRTWQK